jgi:hypothetical protein
MDGELTGRVSHFLGLPASLSALVTLIDAFTPIWTGVLWLLGVRCIASAHVVSSRIVPKQ